MKSKDSVAILVSIIIVIVSMGLFNNHLKHKVAYANTQDDVARVAASPTPTPQNKVEVKVSPTPATREEKLQSYLEAKNSPLAKHADYIVAQADEYDIPWTLVAAISGKESSFGTVIKEDSYNAWGVMAWDKQGNRHIRSFDNWEKGIHFVTVLLSENYRHNMNSAIQEKYCPSFECSDTWTVNVTTFQEEINE